MNAPNALQRTRSFVSIRRHSWLDRLFHMNTTIAEPGCFNERASCAVVPCRAFWAARH